MKKTSVLLLVLVASLLVVACPPPGSDDSEDPGNPGSGSGSTLPEQAYNVTAVETTDGFDEAVAEITWDGDPNDGSYSVVIDTVTPHGEPPMEEWPFSVSGSQFSFGDYGDYYFWVVPMDADSCLHYELETAANSGDPVTYEDPSASLPPIDDPVIVLETDSGLAVADGGKVGIGDPVGIIPDLPPAEHADAGIRFEYSTDDYNWFFATTTEKMGVGTNLGTHTVYARYWNTNTEQIADGSSKVSAAFEIIETDTPTITSLVDANSVPISAGDRTAVSVTLTAGKPTTDTGSGTFQYTLDNEATWSDFSAGNQHVFSANPGTEILFDGSIRFIGSVTSYSTAFPSFTIDKKAPVFTEPTVTAADLAIDVDWTKPADTDLESIIIETSPASSGSYTEWAAYSGVIPASNTDSIATTETIDIRVTATDTAGNSTTHTFTNQTPNTSLANLFVTPGGTGQGGSWSSSAGDLQEAIELAEDLGIPEVWVMAGTYKPASRPNLSGAPDSPEFYHFSLRNGVTVIGGFDGTEVSNIPTYGRDATILSGDFPNIPSLSDDAYHVFFHPGLGLDQTAVLKNVTITKGAADIYSHLGLHTYGGGMYNSYSSPLLIDCSFIGNEAEASGGAMYNNASHPHLINCYFEDNFTSGNVSENGGAAVHNFASMPVFINTIFLDNHADLGNGGCIYNRAGSGSYFYNCTFHGNTARSGASHGQAVYNLQSNPYFYNNIIWNTKGGDTSPIYNDSSIPTEGSNLIYSGTGPAPADDIFVSTDPVDATDLMLKISSAAIGAGTASDLPADDFDIDDDLNTAENIPYDFGGNAREQSTSVDLGAWEF